MTYITQFLLCYYYSDYCSGTLPPPQTLFLFPIVLDSVPCIFLDLQLP